jgi:hypothetical protein
MTIERTVDIPANHWLTIEVPPEVPAGRTILAFTPASVVAEKAGLQDPEPINRDAEYLRRKAQEPRDTEIINRNAERLNREALDVLSYQELDL